jgi:glycine cleavage system aminomethyltransferase T
MNSCSGRHRRDGFEIVNGTQSPSLNMGIGMGYVSPEFAKPDTNFTNQKVAAGAWQ